jgi:hypothetical protein
MRNSKLRQRPQMQADSDHFEIHLSSVGLALAYMYACTAYVHVRTLGYIGEKWRDILPRGYGTIII